MSEAGGIFQIPRFLINNATGSYADTPVLSLSEQRCYDFFAYLKKEHKPFFNKIFIALDGGKVYHLIASLRSNLQLKILSLSPAINQLALVEDCEGKLPSYYLLNKLNVEVIERYFILLAKDPDSLEKVLLWHKDYYQNDSWPNSLSDLKGDELLVSAQIKLADFFEALEKLITYLKIPSSLKLSEISKLCEKPMMTDVMLGLLETKYFQTRCSKLLEICQQLEKLTTNSNKTHALLHDRFFALYKKLTAPSALISESLYSCKRKSPTQLHPDNDKRQRTHQNENVDPNSPTKKNPVKNINESDHMLSAAKRKLF